MDIDFSLWIEKWGDELSSMKITNSIELKNACEILRVPPRVFVGGCLQVSELEQNGYPSTNRKARLKNIIDTGVALRHVKTALNGISKDNEKEVFVPPTDEEVKEGIAETKKCARDILEMIRKKRGINDESD